MVSRIGRTTAVIMDANNRKKLHKRTNEDSKADIPKFKPTKKNASSGLPKKPKLKSEEKENKLNKEVLTKLRSSRKCFNRRRKSFFYDPIITNKKKNQFQEIRKVKTKKVSARKKTVKHGIPEISSTQKPPKVQEAGDLELRADMISPRFELNIYQTQSSDHSKAASKCSTPKVNHETQSHEVCVNEDSGYHETEKDETPHQVTDHLAPALCSIAENIQTAACEPPQFIKSICNMGYNVFSHQSENLMTFKCFIARCPIVLLGLVDFKNHIRNEHSETPWSGFCHSCEKLVVKEDSTMVQELQHLLTVHVKSENEATRSFKFTENGHDYCKPAKVNFQPWIGVVRDMQLPLKPAPVAKVMKSDSCLVATFKCMHASCPFYTSDAGLFRIHLMLHRGETSHACAYCCFRSPNVNSLIGHISDFHKFDIYLCPSCFYRSASCVNVLNHVDIYHPGSMPTVMKSFSKLDRIKTLSVKTSAASSQLEVVAPTMPCAWCDRRFNLIASYREHLKTHVNSQTIVICAKCQMTHSSTSFESHLLKCYSIGMYQCAHCLFGCKSLEPLRRHLADEHATQHPIYYERSQDKVRWNLKNLEVLKKWGSSKVHQVWSWLNFSYF